MVSTLAAALPLAALPDESVLDRKVSVHADNASLRSLLKMLAQAAGPGLLVPPEEAVPDRLVTIDASDLPLSQVLKLLKGAGITWTLKDGKVCVTAGPGPAMSLQPQGWVDWRGLLPDDVRNRPLALKMVEIGGAPAPNLRGSLAKFVYDLRGSGLPITLDPSLEVPDGPAPAQPLARLNLVIRLPVGHESEAMTLEQVLLRLVTACAARRLPVAFLQSAVSDGSAPSRFKVAQVPGAPDVRPGVPASAPPAPTVTFSLPSPGTDHGNVSIYADEIRMDPDGRQVRASGNVRVIERLPSFGIASAFVLPPEIRNKRIDLEVKDLPLPDVLGKVSALIGKPIQLAEGVNRGTRLTLQLKDLSVVAALDTILAQAGLTARPVFAPAELQSIVVEPGAPYSPYWGAPAASRPASVAAEPPDARFGALQATTGRPKIRVVVVSIGGAFGQVTDAPEGMNLVLAPKAPSAGGRASVTVMGAVKCPGRYGVTPELTVGKALALAGGLGEDACGTVYVFGLPDGPVTLLAAQSASPGPTPACAKDGTSIQPGWLFCPQCGQAIAQPPAGWHFCPLCGRALEEKPK